MPAMNTLSESLMSNAFDLIGGPTMAQQFLEHMDFYSNPDMTTSNNHINPLHNAQMSQQQELRPQHQHQQQHQQYQQQQQLPTSMQQHQHQHQQLDFLFHTPRQSSMPSLLQHQNSSANDSSSSSSSSCHSFKSNQLFGQLYNSQQHFGALNDRTAITPPVTRTSPTAMQRQYEKYQQLHNSQQQHSLSPSPTNSNNSSNSNFINDRNHRHQHLNININHLHQQQRNNNNNNILENNFYPNSKHLTNLTNLQMETQQQQQQQQQQATSQQTLAQTVANTSNAVATSAAAVITTTNNLNNMNHNNNSNNLNNNNNINSNSNNSHSNSIMHSNNNGSVATNMTSPSSTTTSSSATSTLTANNQQQQQHQQQNQQHQSQSQQQPTAPHHHHHHHHHQHVAGSTSPYKPCWCLGDTTYHMKILVPAVASGAIIGKGGETIASLQKDTGARVKMSKSHDFYPGTTERVCLITGSIDGIMAVLEFVMDKIREKPDLTSKSMDTESKQSQERDKQVKILVPNSTAGMIIGKGGAYIKQVKEESGSYVQISQKPKDISLQERCITIIGDKENNKNACKMILSKIVEDPQSGTCLNVSYADINGPVANFNPTGSPYATNQNAINSSTASLNSTLGTAIGGAASAAGLLVNGTGINLTLNLSSPNPAPNLALAQQLLEHIKVALRNSGYTETATTEVCAALGVLAKYGVLGMGVGLPHANGAHTTLGSYLGVSALEQQTAAANAAATAGNVFGAVGQVNLDQYTAAAAAAAAAAANRPTQSQLDAAAAQFDPFRHLGTTGQAATPVSLNNNSFGLTAATGTATQAPTLGAATGAHGLGGLSKSPTPGDLGAKDTKNVEIPEVIVGAILGPNGRCLVEIQHISGANVQISKKGIFAPGTRNRIVTITGQPNAIAKAQYLIEQKINEEETKRARQIPLATVVN